MDLDSETKPDGFSDHADPVPPRGPLSPLAVVALLLGLASTAALLSRLLWCIPGLGLMVGALALLRIRHANGRLTGNQLALVGLALSTLFAAWAPTHFYMRQYRIRHQAEAVGAQWLEFITQDELYKAYGSREDPKTRGALDESYRTALLTDKSQRPDYLRFERNPTVLALRLLGDRARVRYYGTEQAVTENDVDTIQNVYAVTYLDIDDDTTKTFFVRLVIERTDNPVHTDGFWQVTRYQGGVRPRL